MFACRKPTANSSCGFGPVEGRAADWAGLMSHEAILYGRIIGATGRPGTAGYFALHERNRAVLNRLPRNDDWPWLVRGMFALPAGHPQGTFRRQVIHFGASIKDDPYDRGIWDAATGR
jgi:hypothetical protein